MVKRIYILLIVIYIAAGLSAQTSEHQRIGVELPRSWELGLELDTSLRYLDYSTLSLFMFEPALSLDLVLDRTWALGVVLPVSLRLPAGQDAARYLALGLGDPTLALGWLGRLGDARLSVGLRASAPLGESSPYAEAEGAVLTGAGRWQVGVYGSASWIMDPAVLGLSLAYLVGLPRAELVGYSWQPGQASLGLSVTEVLNSWLGYSLRLSQQLSLPTVYGASWDPADLAYGVSLSFELWLAKDDWRLPASVSS